MLVIISSLLSLSGYTCVQSCQWKYRTMSLAPFMCLCCWLWAGMHLLKYRFLSNYIVFHYSISFYLIHDLTHVQYGFLFVFLEIFFFDSCVRVIYIKFSDSSLNFYSRQDKILEILILSEDLFITDLLPFQYICTCLSQKWI